MNTLFDLPPIAKHPAKYTDAFLPIMADMLEDDMYILDPFGGTGKVFELDKYRPLRIEALEIEPEWANCHPKTTQGDALAIPWADDTFDAIVTSPTYGNGMAGTYLPSDDRYRRIRYASYIGRNLNPNNSGRLFWGAKYKEFHVKAWTEARRVLKVGGLFILNIKDFIKAGKVQPVTQFHMDTLKGLGLAVVEHRKIEVGGVAWGENSDVRVGYESIIKFRLEATNDNNP